MNVDSVTPYLKIKFTDFDNLLIPMGIQGAPITQLPLFTNLYDVEEWNDFWAAGGSNTIFDTVSIDEDNFEVTLSGNIGAVTYLGYTTFDVKMIGIEINGFINLEEFYGNENPITYITIDNPNLISSLTFNNTALDDNGLKNILSLMSTTNINDGYIDFAGSQTFVPDIETIGYQTTLENKGWTVLY